MSNCTSLVSSLFLLPKRVLALGLLTLPALGGGCNQHPLNDVEMMGAEHPEVTYIFEPQNKVDVLLVIDNSGSMGEEQANLAANFAAFVGTLEDAGADYRIAVTTTDVQNSEWCNTTSPENGNFQATSCRTRLQHFTDQAGGTDVSTPACMEICELEGLGLLPTSVVGDPKESVRPWIQVGGAQSNLPEGVGGAEAFSCMGPQGIDGCGFESPLEAMRLALTRATTVGEDEFGFLREDAALSVIIVTDEVDCSTAPEGEAIFDPGGNKVFWSDPDASSPTSAICWNAGVRCTGDASGYDDCIAVDKGAEGSEASAQDAVLRPVQDYIDVLDGLLAQKQDASGRSKGVHVSLIGGVPLDFASTLNVPYAESTDPAFQDKYGIGAGCSSVVGGVTQEAVPPVRMRELVEAFDGEQMFSVCDDDYTPALEAIANGLTPGLRGACVQECLADTDPVSAGIQPSCRILEEYPDGSEIELGECEIANAKWEVPTGEAACIAYLTDAGHATSSSIDDPDLYCPEGSASIAIELYRAAGTVTPEGAVIRAVCEGDSYSSACN
jgi:hypothetical protein